MIFGVPAWLFLGIMLLSLFLGVGLRKYLDRRKEREARAYREQVKEMKRKLRRDKKRAKKK